MTKSDVLFRTFSNQSCTRSPPRIVVVVDEVCGSIKEKNCTEEQRIKINFLKRNYPGKSFGNYFEALSHNNWDIKQAMNYLSPFVSGCGRVDDLRRVKSSGELNTLKANDLKHWNREYLMKNFGSSKSMTRLNIGGKQKVKSPKRETFFGFKF